MPRPVSDRMEPAYRAWAFEHRGNLSATAEALGIPFSTLQTWKRVYGWEERRKRDLLPELYQHLATVKWQVSLAMPEVVESLLAIVRSSKWEKEKINAGKALHDIYRSMVLADLGDPNVIDVAGAPVTSDAAGYLEANVAQAERKPGRS